MNPNRPPHLTAALNGFLCCIHCGYLNALNSQCCQICNQKLLLRKNKSLQKTLAYLLTAVILYIPANVLPIMKTTLLGDTEDSTIIEGVLLLWQMGSYPIAVVIFIASVVVPLAKMITLLWLCISVSISQQSWMRQRTLAYHLTELMGRWSMVDVFVVIILVALVQLGAIISILPGHAALAFAGVVIFTMLSAHSFDTRLIWDNLIRPATHTIETVDD